MNKRKHVDKEAQTAQHIEHKLDEVTVALSALATNIDHFPHAETITAAAMKLRRAVNQFVDKQVLR
jgi:hypothetical protein